ncbi:hypothetical protein F5Y12DRAFT_79492 [Xylaria sp. FL1777]|nr:hypothetical protein F5Y12DRAFT_79492 [Xylaria sp. FL1777]
METLRRLADIPEKRFTPPPVYGEQTTNWATYVHARTFASDRTPEFDQLASSELQLVDMLVKLEERATSNKDVTASLTLVSLSRDRDENILISKGAFMNIFRRFGIDSRFLQHVKTNRYGLHYDWDVNRVSYYIGTGLYILMWSFDIETRTTRAILLSRDFISTTELGSLRWLLQSEANRLHSPFLLAWISLVHLSHWMDSSTYYLLTTIRQLEELTGYGPYGSNTASSEIPIDKLTQASKNIGYVQVNLANQLRHVTIGLDVASHISTRATKLTDYAVEPYVVWCQRELGEFNSTIPSLQRSLNDSSAYVYYLQERVRSQNTIVYALMTQADARININLAKASKELAEAAKKDGSSMKSIAIMTMLFLPGTYFAALWAVPSLQWGQPDVIQSDFWLYWAFTVPSTLLIFVVWFGLHKWEFRRPKFTRPGKGAAKYEELKGVSPPPTEPVNPWYGPPKPPPFVPPPLPPPPPPPSLAQPPKQYVPTSAPSITRSSDSQAQVLSALSFGDLRAQGYSVPPRAQESLLNLDSYGTQTPTPTIAPPTSNSDDLRAQGYSVPPLAEESLLNPHPSGGQTSAPAAFSVPSTTDVRDYGMPPYPV